MSSIGHGVFKGHDVSTKEAVTGITTLLTALSESPLGRNITQLTSDISSAASNCYTSYRPVHDVCDAVTSIAQVLLKVGSWVIKPFSYLMGMAWAPLSALAAGTVKLTFSLAIQPSTCITLILAVVLYTARSRRANRDKQSNRPDNTSQFQVYESNKSQRDRLNLNFNHESFWGKLRGDTALLKRGFYRISPEGPITLTQADGTLDPQHRIYITQMQYHTYAIYFFLEIYSKQGPNSLIREALGNLVNSHLSELEGYLEKITDLEKVGLQEYKVASTKIRTFIDQVRLNQRSPLFKDKKTSEILGALCCKETTSEGALRENEALDCLEQYFGDFNTAASA